MIGKPEDLFGKVGGLRIRYWTAGKRGSSVLFIHGIGCSMEDWLENIQPLAKKHRVFAVDIPGHGYSDKPDAPYSIEYFADFIDDFLTFQNLDTVTLVGNSLGGGIALQCAHQFPQKINKIVLVSCAGFGKEVSIIFRLIGVPIIGPLLLRTGRKDRVLQERTVKFLSSLVYDIATINSDMLEPLIEARVQIAKLPGISKAVLTVMRRYSTIFGLRSRFIKHGMEVISSITFPVLIVWGENDPVFPVSHAYTGREKLKNAQVHVLQNCGHMAQIEHPDQFNDIVGDFLTD
jgi:4,5:9,10-diseco-3-hydroxy-5,9,17-trioxoandrosta-1(10),2-diene-4-oate hydrolase